MLHNKTENKLDKMLTKYRLSTFLARTTLVLGFSVWIMLVIGFGNLQSSSAAESQQAAPSLAVKALAAQDASQANPVAVPLQRTETGVTNRANGNNTLMNFFQLQAPQAVQPGQQFTVDILANIATPAYGFGFRLRYDPAYVQLVGQTDAEQVAVSLLLGDLFQHAQAIRNMQQQEGADAFIDAIYTLMPPATGSQGEGKVGSVMFKALQAGPTQIELIKPRLIGVNRGQATEIPLTQATNPSLTISITTENSPVVPAVGEPSLVAVPIQPANQSSMLLISIVMAVVIIVLAGVNLMTIWMIVRLSRATKQQLRQLEVRQKFAQQAAQQAAQRAYQHGFSR